MLVSDIDEPVVLAAGRTPFEANRRVFVIEQAETMNDATANRMLKTLEEPPAYAHLILLTDRPGELLATISSRCQDVRFDALPEAELAARLERDGASSPDGARLRPALTRRRPPGRDARSARRPAAAAGRRDAGRIGAGRPARAPTVDGAARPLQGDAADQVAAASRTPAQPSSS